MLLYREKQAANDDEKKAGASSRPFSQGSEHI